MVQSQAAEPRADPQATPLWLESSRKESFEIKYLDYRLITDYMAAHFMGFVGVRKSRSEALTC